MSEADDRIRACLDQSKSFLLDAGAGAGKTYSLVEALKYLLGGREAQLTKRGQMVGCITYTNVAADEITARTGASPSVWVSTIHKFLWEVIKGHQRALKSAVAKFNSSLPLESARRRDEAELAQALPHVTITYSETGSNFLEGRIFHDDLMGVAHILFADNKLLGRLVAAKYPVIFVDEYQDTSLRVVEILAESLIPNGCVVGLFGDKMQSIFDGVGEIPAKYLPLLAVIPKGENRRCSKAVIDVLNRIRTDIKQVPVGANAEGVALYINAKSQAGGDPVGDAQAAVVKQLGWESDVSEVRELYLTHKLIAGKGGYRQLLDVFEKRGNFYKEQFFKGEDRRIAFFMDRVEPLADAWQKGQAGQALSTLRTNGLQISSNAEKRSVRQALDGLLQLRPKATVGELLIHVRGNQLFPLLDDFAEWLNHDFEAAIDLNLEQEARERLERDRTFYSGLFGLPYTQVSSFVAFFNDHTPFATKHGVKGAEFDNVFVVLDDSGARWTQYSFDKFLTGVDANDKPERYRRTQNIFYVCCSRAKRGLAVVDLSARSAAKDQAVQAMFGPKNCIYL